MQVTQLIEHGGGRERVGAMVLQVVVNDDQTLLLDFLHALANGFITQRNRKALEEHDARRGVIENAPRWPNTNLVWSWS